MGLNPTLRPLSTCDEPGRLPAVQVPVFLVLLESSVVSVSTPTGGGIARWQPGAAGLSNTDITFRVQGEPVRMQVSVVDGAATSVRFSSNGHSEDVQVNPDRISEAWGRVRADAGIRFSPLPDYD